VQPSPVELASGGRNDKIVKIDICRGDCKTSSKR